MAAIMEQWSHAETSFLSLFFQHDYENIYVFNIYIFCMLALYYIIYQYLCSVTLCSMLWVIIKIVVTKLLLVTDMQRCWLMKASIILHSLVRSLMTFYHTIQHNTTMQLYWPYFTNSGHRQYNHLTQYNNAAILALLH